MSTNSNTLQLSDELANVSEFTICSFSWTFAGGHLESRYNGDRAGQGRAAQFSSTSDEGAISNSEKRPASAGGELQQAVSRVR